MLSEADNEAMTRVGAGTPMGELLRRYWHPIAAVSELDENPVKAVRLMGEDLVLYRDRSGTYGLVERHCPHRRADLSYGFVDEVGLRCIYHGWNFDEAGKCIAQPFEDTVDPAGSFRDKVRAVAYPVEEKAGMIFAYLGPAPAPLVPNWEPFTYENCFVQIILGVIPCNWLQVQENSVDPVHFEWLHANWSAAQAGQPLDGAKHLKIGFDEWDYGFRYKRILDNTDDQDPRWRIGRLSLLPNVFVPDHFEWRVPIDDTHTLAILWHFTRVPNDRVPYEQERIPHWYTYMEDPDRPDRWLTTRIVNQDAVAVAGQGEIFDRTTEHLGRSDQGILMLRRQLKRDMEAVARGEDPKGVVRDPGLNECIPWPVGLRDEVDRGLTREQWLRKQAVYGTVSRDYFFILDGQPEDVRTAYDEAMGLA